MPLIAAVVGSPNFDGFLLLSINGVDIKFGVFLTVLVNFIIVAAAIYFIVVVPMNHMIARRNAKLGIKDEEPAVDPQIELLTEIRNALTASNRGGQQ